MLEGLFQPMHLLVIFGIAVAVHIVAMGVLQAESVSGPLELGVCITTDGEVRALNRDYLGHDYETDVISFGMAEQASSAGVPRFVTPAEHPISTGGCVSFTVTVKLHILMLFDESLTMHVTDVVPFGKVLPDAGEHEAAPTAGQLSLTVGAGYVTTA